MLSSERSPLARLVLFIVCLSIAGTVIAGMHYYAIDLPQQKALTAPANADRTDCEKSCDPCWTLAADPISCYSHCLVERHCK